MPKPFDATTKYLVEYRPADWLALVGVPETNAHLIDADLATITAEADRVVRVEAAVPWLVHLELQAGYERDMGERILQYNVLLGRRHGLPVQSAVILLRPGADGPNMTGLVQHRLPDNSLYHEFRYQTVRVWQKPVTEILEGGLATLPLAPLCDVAPEALPAVIRRMEERIEDALEPADAGILWTSTFVLMGLRYSTEFARTLLQGEQAMKESVTYQALLAEGREVGREEGRAEGREEGAVHAARTILLRLGTKRFGMPDAATQAAIEAIVSAAKLEQLAERVLDVESWAELPIGA